MIQLKDWTRLLLASMRLNKLVVNDQLGEWWLKKPIDKKMSRFKIEQHDDWIKRAREVHQANLRTQKWNGQHPEHARSLTPLPDAPEDPWWVKYREGLDCPWCVGFWMGAALLLGEAASHSNDKLRWAWKFATSALALNEAAANAGAWLGDFDEDEPQE